MDKLEGCDCTSHCGDDLRRIMDKEVVPCQHFLDRQFEVANWRRLNSHRILVECHAKGMSDREARDTLKRSGILINVPFFDEFWQCLDYRLELET